MSRSYKSDLRKTQSQETKVRILESAKALFSKKGFDSVKIDQIAQKAKVSSSMVYTLFKSKRGLLQTLLDEALPPKRFEELVDKARSTSDPKNRFEMAAKMSREIYEAEKDIMELLSGASLISPELKKMEYEREERRYQRQLPGISELHKQGLLAKGITLKKARDILWTFTGRDLYRLLVLTRGWSADFYEKWLSDTLIKALL